MINFPFGANGKLIILGVQILKHVTVLRPSLELSHQDSSNEGLKCMFLYRYMENYP